MAAAACLWCLMGDKVQPFLDRFSTRECSDLRQNNLFPIFMVRCLGDGLLEQVALNPLARCRSAWLGDLFSVFRPSAIAVASSAAFLSNLLLTHPSIFSKIGI